MSKLYIWTKKIEQQIDIQKENIHRKDLTFYKVDKLTEIAKRLDDYSESCVQCSDLKQDMEIIVSELSENIYGSPKQKKKYERSREKILKHLNDTHDIKAPIYYSSIYSLVGIFGGALVGALAGWIINIYILKFTILVGVAIGMIIGRIIGAKKDKNQRKQNLIL